MSIERIRIKGFKSVADIQLNQLEPYSVFAGPNGSGKSNLADAIGFVSEVVSSGASKAIRKYNGFSQMHCYKFRKEQARTFEFEIRTCLSGDNIKYVLKIHNMDKDPQLEEMLEVQGKTLMHRKRGETLSISIEKQEADDLRQFPRFPSEISGLMIFPHLDIYNYLTNIEVYRFDPLGAKEPDISSADASELNPFGRNLASMLATLEKDEKFRSQILEWMELIVPGMEKVATERQRLDGSTLIKFKEEGIQAHFPANLISDGTIYALCIMTAVLSRSERYGMTIIEEPERGIHPKAITELVALMRHNATAEHPVFVTTHSESVVRASTKEELWLVNKTDGQTQVKNAAKQCGDLGDLNLDKAWLMNIFDGGLPW